MTAGAPRDLRAAVTRAMEHAGSIPAKEAVKLRPADWHAVTAAAEAMARAYEALVQESKTATERRELQVSRLTAELERVRGEVAAGTYEDLGP